MVPTRSVCDGHWILLLIIIFQLKITIEERIDKTSPLATILARLSQIGDLFVNLAKLLSYYVIYGFEAIVSLLKRLENFYRKRSKS